MADLEFTIKTKAELQGAQQMQASLEKQIGTAKALGNDYTELAAKLDKVNKSIEQASPAIREQAEAEKKALEAKKAATAAAEAQAAAEKKAARETSDALKAKAKEAQKAADAAKRASDQAAADQRGAVNNALRRIPGVGGIMDLGASVGSAAVAGIAAVGAAAAVAVKSLTEYAESQQRVAGLDAALAQTGQLTDDYREKLQDLAGQLQTTTGIADDEWIGVLTRLTQFGSTAETIERDTEAVKNLAGVLGGDLAAASNLIARANQGQFQSFSRLGIQVDQNASQTEKLAKLYEELAQRGGGQLEARSRTLTGQFSQLKNATSDLFEAFGRGIAETGALQVVLQGLTDAAAYWAEALGGPVKALDGMTNAQRRTKLAAEESATAVNKEGEAMTALAKKSDVASAALDKVIERLRKTKSEEDQQDEANKDYELALLADRAKVQKLSATQVAKEKAEIEDRFLVRKNARELEFIDKEIAVQKQGIADRVKVEEEARARLDEATRNASAKEQRERAEAQVADLEAEAAVIRKKRDALPTGGYELYSRVGMDAESRRGLEQESADINNQLVQAELVAQIARRKLNTSPAGPFGNTDVTGASAAFKAAQEARLAEQQKRGITIGELTRDRIVKDQLGTTQRATSLVGDRTEIRSAIEADRQRIASEQKGATDSASAQSAKITQAGDQALQAIEKLGASAIQSFSSISTRLDELNRQLDAQRKQFQDSKNR